MTHNRSPVSSFPLFSCHASFSAHRTNWTAVTQKRTVKQTTNSVHHYRNPLSIKTTTVSIIVFFKIDILSLTTATTHTLYGPYSEKSGERSYLKSNSWTLIKKHDCRLWRCRRYNVCTYNWDIIVIMINSTKYAFTGLMATTLCN